MAIDTVRIRSPYVSEDVANVFENDGFMRLGVDSKTMHVHYQFTSADLYNSFDSRISIQVKRKDWITDRRNGKKKPVEVDSRPYLEIECSVHKFLIGHNVYGGSEDLHKAVMSLLLYIEEHFNVPLPKWDIWLLKRCDYAKVFNLLDPKTVEDYFYLMKNGYYPRRNVANYGVTGLYYNATTTVLKMYHKGPEFRKHDFQRYKKFYGEARAFQMLELANNFLRVEIEIKLKKLKYDFGKEPYVSEVTSDYLRKVYDTEIERLIKEGKKESCKARDGYDVKSKLELVYDANLAKTLFSAWLHISTYGLKEYRKTVSKATYYRHLKQLRDSNISWNLSDVEDSENVSRLSDFAPYRDSQYCMDDVDEELQSKLDDAYYKTILPFEKEKDRFERAAN